MKTIASTCRAFVSGRAVLLTGTAALWLCCAGGFAAVNLNVTATDTPDPVDVGATLTYVVTVKNNGSTTATSVKLTDSLPTGVTVKSVVSSTTCTGTNIKICDLNTLAPSNQNTVTIEVTPNTAGTISNVASVTSAETDSSTADNETSVTTTVVDPDDDFFGGLEGTELTGEFTEAETICREDSDSSRTRCVFRGAFTVYNEGMEESTTFTVGIVLSHDEFIDNEDILLEFRRGVLRGNRAHIIRWNEKLKPGRDVSDRFLIGYVDVKNEVEEEDEDDNLIVDGPLE